MTRFTLPLAAAALLATASAAFAHAHLRSADPAVDSTVATAPTEVAITFSSAVEPSFSSIEVQDAGGKRVDDGKTHTQASDVKVLSVGLGPLAAGTYTVTWHVTAIDTHKTDGTFTFTVKP